MSSDVKPTKQSFHKIAVELTNWNYEAISMMATLLGGEAIESKSHVRIWARAVPTASRPRFR
jgi:hypothetical protein